MVALRQLSTSTAAFDDHQSNRFVAGGRSQSISLDSCLFLKLEQKCQHCERCCCWYYWEAELGDRSETKRRPSREIDLDHKLALFQDFPISPIPNELV